MITINFLFTILIISYIIFAVIFIILFIKLNDVYDFVKQININIFDKREFENFKTIYNSNLKIHYNNFSKLEDKLDELKFNNGQEFNKLLDNFNKLISNYKDMQNEFLNNKIFEHISVQIDRQHESLYKLLHNELKKHDDSINKFIKQLGHSKLLECLNEVLPKIYNNIEHIKIDNDNNIKTLKAIYSFIIPRSTTSSSKKQNARKKLKSASKFDNGDRSKSE